MEESLIEKPSYSEKTRFSNVEKKPKTEEMEVEDYYNKEQKVPINGFDRENVVKPQVFSVSGLSEMAENKSENNNEKINFDEQKAEEWVEEWLSEDLIDAYALSYEKSKKSSEEKRKNKKYQKYHTKAQEEIKEYLKERLSTKLLSGEIEENTDHEKVKEIILKILKSDLRATRLFKIMKNHDYQQAEKFDNKNNPEKAQPSEEEILTSTQTGVSDDFDDKGPNLNKNEAPKSKEDFFQQFPFTDYVNKRDGSDLKILNYDLETQEVSVYQYQSFVYNKENDFWGPAKEKGQEKTFKYRDFLELMKDYSPDQDSEETEKNPERIQLRGFYINEKGEFFKPKEYFVIKNKEGKEEKFIEIEIDKNVNGKKNSIMSSDDYHKFIQRGNFNFYDNGKEMEEAFNKKLERLKSEVENFEIFGIYYHSGEGKYLVKIKKPDQKAEYINFKKLLEMVKEDKNKKEDEKEKGLNQIERKIFEIFKEEVENYKKGVYEKTGENPLLKENTRNLIVRDYMENYSKERLPKRIKEKVEQYKISDVDQEKILEEFKKEFSF